MESLTPSLVLDNGGVELTSTASRRESESGVLPHRINDLPRVVCG
jgi:hypothetical protein